MYRRQLKWNINSELKTWNSLRKIPYKKGNLTSSNHVLKLILKSIILIYILINL